MDWVALSSKYYMDPAVESLTGDAERMMIRALAYCGNAETFGYITLKSISNLGLRRTQTHLKALLDVGILSLTETQDVYYFTKWDKWQEPANAHVRKKKRDRDRAAEKRSKTENVARQSRDASRDGRHPQNRTEQNKEEEQVSKPSYVGTAEARPKAARTIAEHLNGTAHTPAAHAIARAYSDSCQTPIAGNTLAKIAQAIDSCLTSGIDRTQIEIGIRDWAASSMTAPSTIPDFVHKAANRPTPTAGASGVGKATAKAMGWASLGNQLAQQQAEAISGTTAKGINA